MGLDEDLFSSDVSDLEDIARKYVLSVDFDEFLEAMNLPVNDDQRKIIYVEGEKHLKTLFNSLLAFDKTNLYGNFGMFIMESYVGTPENAMKYALTGINNNPDHYDVYELRTSLAEMYEAFDNYRDANQQYIANINSTLGYMKTYIDDFFKESVTKLVFTDKDIKINLVEDKSKSALNTYIKADNLEPFAVETQDESKRQEFAKALMLQESGQSEPANEILGNLNSDFITYQLNLHTGIEGLKQKVETTYKERVYKTLAN